MRLALGQASLAAEGFAAAETGRAYARVRELCRELGDAPEFFPALYGRFIVHFQRGELAVALEAGRELLAAAGERSDAAARVTGQQRWSEGVRCPACGSATVIRHGRDDTQEGSSQRLLEIARSYDRYPRCG